jgi:hypothetical protein
MKVSVAMKPTRLYWRGRQTPHHSRQLPPRVLENDARAMPEQRRHGAPSPGVVPTAADRAPQPLHNLFAVMCSGCRQASREGSAIGGWDMRTFAIEHCECRLQHQHRVARHVVVVLAISNGGLILVGHTLPAREIEVQRVIGRGADIERKPAGVRQERSTEHRRARCPDEILREPVAVKIIRSVDRGKSCREHIAIDIDDLTRPDNATKARISGERFNARGDRARQQFVVSVQEQHQLAAGRREASIPGLAQPLVSLAQQAHLLRSCYLRSTVSRAVVDDDDLGARIVLALDAGERLAQEVPVVEARDNDADERQTGHRFGHQDETAAVQRQYRD